jgi:hypothetical protein
MVEREIPYRREDRLVRCEAKGASITWPIPLDNLVDDHVTNAVEVGPKKTRRELVAAVLLAVPRDGERLAELITTYRKAKVADVAPNEAQGENVIAFRVRGPGPRVQRQ